VMAKTEALGDVSNGWGCAFRRSGNLQEELMLLGMKADLHRGLLAELQKAPQGVAEVSQKAHLLNSGIGRREVQGHIYIVSRCKSRKAHYHRGRGGHRGYFRYIYLNLNTCRVLLNRN
jgi:hypothetical protein